MTLELEGSSVFFGGFITISTDGEQLEGARFGSKRVDMHQKRNSYKHNTLANYSITVTEKC